MTLILTGVYCGVAFHDIIGYGKAVMTDSRWYQDGFCVWEAKNTLSFAMQCVAEPLTVHVRESHITASTSIHTPYASLEM